MNSRSTLVHADQRGFTLIELVLVIVLISVASVPLFGLFTQATASLLENEDMRKRAAKTLEDEYRHQFRTQKDMILPVKVARSRKLGSTVEVSVESGKPRYAEAFLEALLESHKQEWAKIQNTSSEKGGIVRRSDLNLGYQLVVPSS